MIFFVVILLGFIFFEPAYGWKVRAWLVPQSGSSPSADSQTAATENEVLKAQLAKLQSIALQLPQSSPQYIPAIVYSRYPLNFKNEVLVNAGTNQGVIVGKAAVFQGIMIGNVLKTFPNYSLVQTIFDSTFKMPVRIGAAGADALLIGGSYPKVTSIEKKASLKPGDIVFTAVAGAPYGLPVAVVASTSTSPDSLFQEATLNFVYDVNGIQALLIAK